MPFKPCLTCGRLSNNSRCPAHTKERERTRTIERLQKEPWRAIYNTGEWKRVRVKALVRDTYACIQCGSRANVSVDHIIPLSAGGAPYELSNLRTLCRPHHQQQEDLRRNTK